MMKALAKKALAAKFFLARKAKNITQTEIAKLIGVHQSQYQRIETGKIGIDGDKLLLLCAILDLDFSDLIESSAKTSHLTLTIENLKSTNNIKELQRIAEIEISKRDQTIYKLKREIKALTRDF